MLQLGMLLGALALPVLVKDGIQKNRRQIDLLISVYGQSHDAIVFADPKWPLKLLWFQDLIFYFDFFAPNFLF